MSPTWTGWFGLALTIKIVWIFSKVDAQCPPGSFQETADKILVICDVDCENVQYKLLETNSFGTIDTFSAQESNPTIEILRKYDAVFVFTMGFGFNDAELVGNVLATYHDQGGGVVAACCAICSTRIKGAYAILSNGYALSDFAGWCISGQDSFGYFTEWLTALVTGRSIPAPGGDAF